MNTCFLLKIAFLGAALMGSTPANAGFAPSGGNAPACPGVKDQEIEILIMRRRNMQQWLGSGNADDEDRKRAFHLGWELGGRIHDYEAKYGRNCYPTLQVENPLFESLELQLLNRELTGAQKQKIYNDTIDAIIKQSDVEAQAPIAKGYFCGYYPDYVCPSF